MNKFIAFLFDFAVCMGVALPRLVWAQMPSRTPAVTPLARHLNHFGQAGFADHPAGSHLEFSR
jgi:hypothetical protein